MASRGELFEIYKQYRADGGNLSFDDWLAQRDVQTPEPTYEDFLLWLNKNYGALVGQGITASTQWLDKGPLYEEYLNSLGYPTEPQEITPDGTTGGTTTPETPTDTTIDTTGGTVVPGSETMPEGSILYGYYDDYGYVYVTQDGIYFFQDPTSSTWVQIPQNIIDTLGNPTSTEFLGGVPTKEQSDDGTWWWVYRDTDGNIINVEQVTPDTEEMTEYEKAQYDLQQQQLQMQQQQWAWEMANEGQMSEFEQAQLEQMQAQQAAKYSEPRDWIQRWTYDWMANSPERQGIVDQQTELGKQLQQAKYQNYLNQVQGVDTTESQSLVDQLQSQYDGLQAQLDSIQAPNAPSPDFLQPYTGIQTGQPIYATNTKLGSGQSISAAQPSELEGIYGYIDWAAGRADTPYASGEDWMYESQKLLPKKAPKRAYSWSAS